MAHTNVSSCVLSILGSFSSGLDVFKKLREKRGRRRRARKNETIEDDEQRLSRSLRQGPEDIGREYQRNLYAAGHDFEIGDGEYEYAYLIVPYADERHSYRPDLARRDPARVEHRLSRHHRILPEPRQKEHQHPAGLPVSHRSLRAVPHRHLQNSPAAAQTHGAETDTVSHHGERRRHRTQ